MAEGMRVQMWPGALMKWVLQRLLKYRIFNDQTMVNKEIGPLQDAQRAIQVVKENAKEWGDQ